MQCPICKADLTPLDLTSRTEHVNLCVENGPSTIDINSEGKLVIKKTIDPKKIRKICPICDKTFQNLNSHFKTCALKNDVPPSLMLDYWEKINADTNNPKKFPRELLDSFVTKCIKEGRVGEQVDFAKALSLSMADGEDSTTIDSTSNNLDLDDNTNSSSFTPSGHHGIIPETANDITKNLANLQTNNPRRMNAEQILMQKSNPQTTRDNSKTKKKYRLELADETLKRANVDLRIDRELAASRTKRYLEAISSDNNENTDTNPDECDNNDADVVVIHESQPTSVKPTLTEDSYDIDLNKLFYRARMKNCEATVSCANSSCTNHDLVLLLDDFKIYSGPWMDSTSRKIFDNTDSNFLECDAGSSTSRDM